LVHCCFHAAIFARFCTGGQIGQHICMPLVLRYAATLRNWQIVRAKAVEILSAPTFTPTPPKMLVVGGWAAQRGFFADQLFLGAVDFFGLWVF